MKILDLMEAIDEGSFNQMAAAAKDIQRTAQQPAKDQALSDKWAARKAAPADVGANYGQGTQATPAPQQAPAAQAQPAPQAAPAPAEQPTAQEPAPAAQAPAEPAQQPTAQEPEAKPAAKGPGLMSKVGGALSKAADAAPGVLGKVGNIGAAAMDAAGRTVGGAVSGYKYARGEQQSAQVPGQRQDAPQQAPAPQQQGGGALGAIANMTRGGGQPQAQGAPNFNKIINTIPKLSANQKAQVIKAAGGGAKVAPPAPKVVQGGKPAMAVAESVEFYSNFLGRNL